MNTRQIQRFRNLIKTMAELRTAIDMSRVHKCGTPSCVLGHYAARRDLQHTFNIYIGLSGLYSNNDSSLTGVDTRTTQDHFGINRDEAWELFGSSGRGDAVTPKQVIAYVKRFLGHRGITV